MEFILVIGGNERICGLWVFGYWFSAEHRLGDRSGESKFPRRLLISTFYPLGAVFGNKGLSENSFQVFEE
jgi:hypothetical protein